jgi:hypothetical protein
MPTSGRRRGIGSVRYGCVIAVGAPGQAPSRAARGHPARGGRIEGVAVTQGGSLERLPGRHWPAKRKPRGGLAGPHGMGAKDCGRRPLQSTNRIGVRRTV